LKSTSRFWARPDPGKPAPQNVAWSSPRWTPAERNWLDGRTGYKRSSRDAYLQRLSARELIDLPGGMPRASASLFD